MNARTQVRSRRLTWSGAALGAALAAGLVAAAPADAASTRTTTVRTVPFTTQAAADGTGPGGRGTVRANAAVAAACNDGVALVAPQWFAVGERTTGSIVAGTASEAVTGTAVVDHWTGRVLACDAPVSRAKKAVDVVAYFASPVADASMAISISRASAAPANDHPAAATPITSLPFTATVNTAAADADGPALKNYGTCELSNLEPVQSNTVWYRYRPATTGAAPVITATPATGWADANTHGAWAQQTGILEVLPDGGTRLVENADPWDCDTPVTLTAGTDYLIGVYYGSDAYTDDVPVSGGPVDFSVTAR